MESDKKAEALLQAPMGRALVAHLVGLGAEDIAVLAGVDLGGVPYRSRSEHPGHDTDGSTPSSKEAGVITGARFSAEQVKAIRETVRAAVTARANPHLQSATVQHPSSAVEASLLREVGDFVENFAFGATSGWLALQEPLSVAINELMPASRRLAENPATAWWWDSAPLDEQRWCGLPPVPQAATADALSDHSGGPSQRWWVTPTIGLGTTRALFSGACVYSLCREGHTTYVETNDEVIAPARVTPKARVYEVTDPQGWIDLVEMYPLAAGSHSRPNWEQWSGHSGPWWLPDWDRCAQDWDGVHVSIGAYFSSAYEALATEHGMTFLAGWNPDETVWLNSVVDIDVVATRGAH